MWKPALAAGIKKALPGGALERTARLRFGKFPKVSAWTPDASALIVACTRCMAVRSGSDIVEIHPIGDVVIELSIEKVVFQGVIPGVGQGRLP